MRRSTILLSVLACAGLFLVLGATEAQAQLVPCCEGGYKPDRLCDVDSDCPAVCIGGFRDGRPCGLDGTPRCPNACVGGSRAGNQCKVDADCPGGSCTNVGECSGGTCTGLCERRRKKPTPSEPILSWLEGAPVAIAASDEGQRPAPCP